MPPGDVAILVDASGNMGEDYGVVREQVVDFVSSLSPTENVSVYLLASNTGVALAGAGDVVGPQAEERIPRETLTGTGTDIGLAIHNGLQWLERDGAQATRVVSPPEGAIAEIVSDVGRDVGALEIYREKKYCITVFRIRNLSLPAAE